jgi:hypothetical protein
VKRLITLIAALLMTVTACGGGDDSADANTAKSNISDSLMEGAGGDDSVFDQDAADCFGDKVVDEVGVEKLQEYGVLDDDLSVRDDISDTKMSEDDAGKAADAFTDCVDFEEFFEATFAGDDETDQEVVDCLREAIDEDRFHDIMKAGFAGDQQAAQEAMEPAMKCMMSELPSETPSP